MSQFTLPRSIGLKLIVVCALVLLMGIPAGLVSLITFDRSMRADQITNEVSRDYGGAQKLMGPVLIVPYTRQAGLDQNSRSIYARGEYVFFAEDGKASVPNLATETRHRSLYRVTTYSASVNFDAEFKLPALDDPAYADLDFGKARIVIGMSNVRGLQDAVYLSLPGGERMKFAPSTVGGQRGFAAEAVDTDYPYPRKSIVEKIHAPFSEGTNLSYMTVPLGGVYPQNGGRFSVSASVPISGAESLSVLPFAQTSKLGLASDWPHPGFSSTFRPTTREISESGFSAQWSVPLLARNVAGEGPAHELRLRELTSNSMGVNLVQPVTPYQKVSRALKYAILFIGLVFLGYFLFEILVGKRVHPAQYLLIGLLQCVFYLMLLALSEQIGFTAAFLLAASGVVIVTSGYAAAVFANRKYGLRAGTLFAAIYALLFGLMQAQDYALMLGALTCFAAITLTLYLTRNLDWYGGKKPA